jgi:transaldolase/glucose-6-phosphate isomerase
MSTTDNPLRKLADFGEAFWLDYIRRNFVEGGELAHMIEADGLRGMTSNPSIFEKAIAGSKDYDDDLHAARNECITDAQAVFERIATRDIRGATDLLRPVYEQTGGLDGYVSLEVSPSLARDATGTIAEARKLWKMIDRPNLMVKVPATPEGLPAVEQLLSEGININITLLFSVAAYEKTAEAYLRALERRAAAGQDVHRMASVASFFISRIDSAADAALKSKWKDASESDRPRIEALLGKTAIANAKRAYALFGRMFGGARWQALESKGARPQRLLWASTSTKDPKYRDVMYIEELIGPHTVNTMPPATAVAFRDHGQVRNAITEDVEGAERRLGELESLGISLDKITDRLLVEGLDAFSKSYEDMLVSIRAAIAAPRLATQSLHLPDALAAAVDETIADWDKNGKVKRLWNGDASLWTGKDEVEWLGWLRIAEDQLGHIERFKDLSKEVATEGFEHAVVLGMGGSSLAPEVLSRTFGRQPGFPKLEVLDSTNPDEIRALEARLDLRKTLFIVSSKSGSTLEPNLYYAYFRKRMIDTVGAYAAGNHFIAITDPGSAMERVAQNDGFRRILHGLPSIGGRYSALSDFGMIPAAAAGLDVELLLNGAEQMVHACASCVATRDNPGLVLGAALGTLGRMGRDKVTIIASPAIQDLGAWLEQLIAESTGKLGRGLVPVDREPLGPPEVYGSDRVFVYIRFSPQPDAPQDEAVLRLAGAGHPVVRIGVSGLANLGAEFFRWEFAIAVAGSVLGINPFDQPDVEAAKIATRKLTEEYEQSGSLPAEEPVFSNEGIQVFADGANRTLVQSANPTCLADVVNALFQRLNDGDYVAVLAYIQRNKEHEDMVESMRVVVRDSCRVATVGGFGPRFLHSTGQAYKGGPNSGAFIQITSEHANDLPVPDRRYTFGVVQNAQARGDLEVLNERGRRALRVHLPADVDRGLETLGAALRSAVSAAKR